MTQKFQKIPTIRMFAQELRDTSDIFEKDIEGVENKARMVRTPTGAEGNKAFIVGTLTEVNMDEHGKYVKARVCDPTGAFPLYAGAQYQPEAFSALKDISYPAFVALVGKVHGFKRDDGSMTFSIQPEIVCPVDKDTRNMWVADTAVLTQYRLDNNDVPEDVAAGIVEMLEKVVN